MQHNTSFKFRAFIILVLAAFLVVPMIVSVTATVSAQDGECDDDEYYDDECFDDEYNGDDCYDDDCYDIEYDDDEFDDANGGEEEVVASYDIEGIELLGDPEGDYIDLWDGFVEVIPDQYLDRFTIFEIIDDEETTGYVYLDDDGDHYILALSLTLLDEPDELTQTAIHEFGHTVTLNAEQVDGTFEGGSCPTFELDEGCSDEESYIFAFYTTFYSDGESTNEDDFVTEYASENIVEDMAESFTFFVMDDEERTVDTIADEKVNFFYDFPELVDLRDEIREDLADN